MALLPQPLLNYLSTNLLAPRSPAYLCIDKDGHLADWGGALDAYGLSDLECGKPVEELLVFLAGFFPLEPSPLLLPYMKTGNGHSTDVHLVPGQATDWILLLDATQEEQSQMLLQQKTNDLALLRQQQATLQAPGSATTSPLLQLDMPLRYQRETKRMASPEDTSHTQDNGHLIEPTESIEPDDLAELRHLLVGPEQSQILALQDQLNDRYQSVESLSRVLPQAIALRSDQDEQLAQALAPTIEASLQTSVQKDPQPLVDAIFPVIGPAIRKAISQALEGLLQSLNSALEHSFSLKGLRWRVEAWRTGRPFAEVVLSHTLLYRVEQVFLIHRHSGLLLQHVTAETVSDQGADMVSGMLTAIQDFAHDSFHVAAEESLESLQVGELTVWVEPSPHAIIAAVIRGKAPQELRTTLQNTIELIHLKNGKLLDPFSGDTAPFEVCRPDLEACLESQHHQPTQTRPSVALWLLFGTALIGLGVWVFWTLQERGRWSAYIETLQAEPGIIVISTRIQNSRYMLTGLRDPLAADPEQLLQATLLQPDSITSQWEPYQALHPDFVLKRAHRILNPPATVRLTLDQNQLIATGSAPRKWISTAKTLTRAIAGVTHFQMDSLEDEDVQAVARYKTDIEKSILRFEVNSVQLAPDQEENLVLLQDQVHSLLHHADIIGAKVQIVIVGSTDSTGTAAINQALSQARADQIRSLFITGGIPAGALPAIGRGESVVRRVEGNEQDQAFNRSVSFRVIQTEDPPRALQ